MQKVKEMVDKENLSKDVSVGESKPKTLHDPNHNVKINTLKYVVKN